LGHEIGSEGIRWSEEKIEAIEKWPVHKIVRMIKNFVGVFPFNNKYVGKIPEFVLLYAI
jgi:hypothetical protein